MHAQSWHAHVDLPTVRALLGQLAVQTAMCLLVSRQVRRRSVGFSALVTGVRRFDWLRDRGRILAPRSAVSHKESVIRVGDRDPFLIAGADPLGSR